MATSPSPGEVFFAALKSGLPAALPQFLPNQRWFGGKARTLRSVEVRDTIAFPPHCYFILVQVNYAAGPAETYDIPLSHLQDGAAASGAPLLRINPPGSDEILLQDALKDEPFLARLFQAIAGEVSLPGAQGRIRAVSTSAFHSLWQPEQGPLKPSVMKAEQSNSSVVYEKRLVLKAFRRLEEGLNPDLEIGAFLTEKSSFRNVPPLAGYLEYLSAGGTRTSLGIMQGYVANQGDAWQFTLTAVAEYYRQALRSDGLGAGEIPHAPLVALCAQPIPDVARQRIGSYFDSAALLGRRTAELHLALASNTEDPDFAPQPFSEADHRGFVNSALELMGVNFDLLRRFKAGMPDHTRSEADKVLELESVARRRFQLSGSLKSSALVTRIHGDYHLGQVLFTGSDFVIIDFEGEPARPLEERRKKRSPLQDVAGMLRSFHYAAYAPLFQKASAENSPPPESRAMGDWARYWQKWVSAAFLAAYLDVAGNATFIPQGREELALLLDRYLLDKAVYELGYELNNRPSWVPIPLEGISQLLQES